mgnify:CR=1 FL=1
MKLKWKDIYNNNKQRRYCEITGRKKQDVELESNSFRILKQNKYLSIIITVILIAILFFTFRKDIRVFLIVLAFFAVAAICFFIFNYFKLRCTSNGLYIRFGMQEGLFPYEKLKSVYLSKFNDYRFLIPSNGYSIVIRYYDNNNRIKELSFANYFLNKQETINFLENFNIKEERNNRYITYEKFKVLRKIIKVTAIVVFTILIFVAVYINMKNG